MPHEFTPGEIKSRINVYLDDKQIKPLIATLIYMSEQENAEIDGYIDLVELERDEQGNVKYSEDGKPVFKPKNPEIISEIVEANKLAKVIDVKPITEQPEPLIKRYHGKIRWELAK